MKKTGIIALALLASATFAFASGSRETVTVEGKLAVTDSVPTVTSGGKTYELPVGPFYRIAWEKSIKIGDTVKIEGTAVENPGRPAPAAASGTSSSATAADADRTVLMPSKLWVNGKEIDLAAYDMGPGGMGMGRMGGGRMAGDCEDCASGMMGGRGQGGRGQGVPGMGNRR